MAKVSFVRRRKPRKIVLKPEQKLMIRVFDYIRDIKLFDDLTHHPPNEGKRSWIEGGILKRMGMTKDTPDIYIMYPTAKYHGLIIEAKELNPKTGKYGRATPGQIRKIKKLNEVGYYATIGKGYDEIISIIENYLKDEV